tara:strand:+ start:2011 stop:2328 length:318 start_codon:yes stop_codon:yes gene_type:complete
LKINIFSYVILVFLSINFQTFAEVTKVNISDINELKCLYKVNSQNGVVNSELKCSTIIEKKNFIEGLDEKNCKSQNYRFKRKDLFINKVAIYCLNFNEKKYIQIF